MKEQNFSYVPDEQELEKASNGYIRNIRKVLFFHTPL